MFTGIIEEIGTIEAQTGNQLTIHAPKISSAAAHGDSIAVNGVCLTVASKNKAMLVFDIMETTGVRSSLQSQKRGAAVNLERAVRPDSLLGGHIVQGHTDGVGVIQKLRTEAQSVLCTVKATRELTRMMIERGSIALDGVSLTIAELSDDSVTVSLIPTTRTDTILGSKKIGDTVNIETDVLGKYVQKYISTMTRGPEISEDVLKRTGFML